ncbi:MAG: hypothetical protein Q7J98_08645 [Kiritimatiellia bacterium]|nr:hypothetical protein [Kiritimatiellia bacterium]
MRPKIDYSPEAITQRLKQVDDLRRTCLMLAGPRLKWSWQQISGEAPRGACLVPMRFAVGPKAGLAKKGQTA